VCMLCFEYDYIFGRDRACLSRCLGSVGGGGGGFGGGFGGGGGGGPPPRDGDWTCGDCGANVFASKTEVCKICVAGLEVRGGLGAPSRRTSERRWRVKDMLMTVVWWRVCVCSATSAERPSLVDVLRCRGARANVPRYMRGAIPRKTGRASVGAGYVSNAAVPCLCAVPQMPKHTTIQSCRPGAEC
jgi:hypothetical protein